MNQNWHGTLIRHLLLLVAACLVVGLISGYYGWSLAIGLAFYLGWTLKQLLRLHEWLRQHKPDEAPPDGYGLWGEVFDSIYHLQRRDQRVRGRLQHHLHAGDGGERQEGRYRHPAYHRLRLPCCGAQKGTSAVVVWWWIYVQTIGT